MFDNKLDPGNQIKKKKKGKTEQLLSITMKTKSIITLYLEWEKLRDKNLKEWKNASERNPVVNLGFFLNGMSNGRESNSRKENKRKMGWVMWAWGKLFNTHQFGKWVIANEELSFTESFESNIYCSDSEEDKAKGRHYWQQLQSKEPMTRTNSVGERVLWKRVSVHSTREHMPRNFMHAR